jgi:uncharacterized MnhB-related membrane protein
MFVEYISYALQGILIVLAIAIVLHKNNGTIIILIASFSLVTASLYIINRAPDVAIAEIAIGSAIIPLIYVISISRQREFIVLDKVMDDFIITDDQLSGIGYVLLHRLTDFYHLELNITNDSGLCQLDENMDKVVCEQTNVDLIIAKDPKTGQYVFKGNKSSVLMRKLETIVSPFDNIKVELFEGRDLHD